MKRVLIISPYFPPSNAADMHRIRMSLPFFKDFGWECEIVSVMDGYSRMNKDPMLLLSVPQDTIIHFVNALPIKWTSLFGLGSIALRSFWFYKNKVSRLLKNNRYDLVYFSTTQFPICVLGAYWKRKHGIPFVIDMQDPWFTDYYDHLPKDQLPRKHWFSGRLNKIMEPFAMKHVDGLISVADQYLHTLEKRYTRCKVIPKKTISFGASEGDFKIASENKQHQPSILPKIDQKIKIVYAGRGGSDMNHAVTFLFRAFKACLTKDYVSFKQFHFYFIGTSYAPAGEGKFTIQPIAHTEGVNDYVTEITERIPFYQTLNTLSNADALFVPGSNDRQYTASKIYPYILANRPLLALFHQESSVIKVLQECKVGTVVTFDEGEEVIIKRINCFLEAILHHHTFQTKPDTTAFDNYSARTMTLRQCELFNDVVK